MSDADRWLTFAGTILVVAVLGGRAPAPFAGESIGVLREAGAKHLDTTLIETRGGSC